MLNYDINNAHDVLKYFLAYFGLIVPHWIVISWLLEDDILNINWVVQVSILIVITTVIYFFVTPHSKEYLMIREYKNSKINNKILSSHHEVLKSVDDFLACAFSLFLSITTLWTCYGLFVLISVFIDIPIVFLFIFCLIFHIIHGIITSRSLKYEIKKYQNK